MRVFVTVGMGPWPFDRLLEAVRPLCDEHDVFVQTGPSEVRLPCATAPFVGFAETRRRLAEADVVVTHGGNTVRLVQREGKLPVVVAREGGRGEMANDHQVTYVEAEQAAGRVLAAGGDHPDLVAALAAHPAAQEAFRAHAQVPQVADGRQVADLLDLVTGAAVAGAAGPFRDHPLRRYAWAYAVLSQRQGRHLDVGSGIGTFLQALDQATAALDCVGVDVHAGYRAEALDGVTVLPTDHAGRLPFADASVDSASMLDVLEHVADERASLAEVFRVLRPGGLLVVTVPAQHAFSVLDPDNVKFRFPRLHRWVYTRRFGEATYRERFVDTADQLTGDLAANRGWHTNYRPADLLELVEECGFTPVWRDGANLFWRWLHGPQLLLPGRAARWLDAPLRWDGRAFHAANLHLVARRPG